MTSSCKRREFLAATAALGASTLSWNAWAQSKDPVRPVTVIDPFQAGNNSDYFLRAIAEEMAKILGQPFIVENKPGSGGALGTEALARAQPDGYTLGLASVSTHAANPAVNKAIRYDPIKDFAPITNMVTLPSITVVPAASPLKTLEDLIAAAKAKPGTLTFASPGIGSAGHILMEYFSHLVDAKFSHIPYRGSAAILNDLLGGQLDVASDNAPALIPHLRSGKLRALAVRDLQRIPQLPDTPTFKELGFAQISRPLWFGLVAPAGTPANTIDRLNQVARQAMATPTFQKRAAEVSARVTPNSPHQFAEQIQQWLNDFKKVVQSAHITLE